MSPYPHSISCTSRLLRAKARNPDHFRSPSCSAVSSPKENIQDATTSLAFAIQPSDPDFPFELPNGLECTLNIPADYAKPIGRGGGGGSGRPSLKVRNAEMGEQWRRGVERGFERIVERMLNLASLRRMTESRQLESRLGRLAGFDAQATGEGRGEGIVYTILITPRKPHESPLSLQAVGKIKLSIPPLYPLQPSTVELLGACRDATGNVETGFELKVEEGKGTLTGYINMLVQNVHLLAMEDVEESVQVPKVEHLRIE
ncbi:MAG: hypothetical protein Q9217_007010, partial [Psora testacea]